jgi:tRNA(adenine34) deaminase
METAWLPDDETGMRLALREARLALDHDDVPVGAVVVRGGEVIGAGHNERELRQDPTAHAEIIALRAAAAALGSWRVLDSVLYVTLEPCAMCAGAIVCSPSRASTTGPPCSAACCARSARRCSSTSSPPGADACAMLDA